MSGIRGPLGIWSFPFLNMIRQLIAGRTGALQPMARNSETIQWTDWKGRPREILIHRQVEG